MYFRYILRRLGQTIIVLFFISILAFALIRIAPGNPARMMLPDTATEEQVHAKEIEMGLDKPLYIQYIKYIGGVLRGDLGTSASYQTSVGSIIADRFPATLLLTAATILVSLLISIPIGIIAGIRQGSMVDFLAMLFALIGQSMSTVWLAVMMIYIFSVKLNLLPALGMGGIKYLILPAITLGYPLAAQVTRMGRSGMIDVLREDYITATLAKGIPESRVYTKYAFKNALIPIVTVVGLQVGYFLGGAVVVETIFSWSGVGQLANQAVGNRDYALVQSLLLVIAAGFALVNLIVDLINAKIDPRITLE
ncbi:MAG: ABC transporter permease [Lachnospiraceae bacterium]|nr:ABC transporter permease [Lachnospiraceae bacterium]